MAEQPRVLERLIARADEIARLVRGDVPRPLTGTAIVARGSSDHASVVGRYLLELATGRPVSLVAPSLHTLYRARVDYSGQLAVAVSQSGRTPEIVTTLRALQDAGAVGVAITNDLDSPLASSAHVAIGLDAGEELAVPATKTATAEVAAFALLARGLGDARFEDADLAALPGAIATILADAQPAARVAAELAGETRLVVTARGLLYGAALETALKLQETAGIAADGISSADLRHGPIAIVGDSFPVIAVSAEGPAHRDVHELVVALRARRARVVTISTDEDGDLRLPPMVEALASVGAVVRGQQLARELALAVGRDPDAPAGLRKVTET